MGFDNITTRVQDDGTQIVEATESVTQVNTIVMTPDDINAKIAELQAEIDSYQALLDNPDVAKLQSTLQNQKTPAQQVTP